MAEPREDSGTQGVRIRIGKVDSITLFQVTESELEDLERGGSSAHLLNIAIFLFSAAIASTIALLSVEIASIKIFCVFVIFSIMGFVGGITLFIIWRITRRSSNAIIKRIKARVKSETAIDKEREKRESINRG